MELIAPTDSMFLLAESREHPMHVGSLQLYEPPDGAGPDFAHGLHESLSAAHEFHPTFRKHPAATFGPAAALAWTYDDDVELDYHLRRSALPRPGRVRELLEFASLQHGTLLDRHRPLWEQHIIEGLADGRIAVYTKLHHALIDGAAAQRLVQRTLSDDPSDTEVRVPWNLPHRSGRGAGDDGSPVDRIGRLARTLASVVPSGAALARSVLDEQLRIRPFGAPRTMFNVPIGGARRVAAQSWPLDRIRAVKNATGTSVNDVVLAMCSAALRRYLTERRALPDESLIAMVPVSLRTADEVDAGGNLVGVILCNLATDLADPAGRLRAISASMTSGKEMFASMSRMQALVVSALLVSPLGLNATVPGYVSATRPPFNLVISNVPGPLQPMYWQGARLVGNYPLSIALDGQAMNITLATNADQLDFGIVGCRRSVPSLQRLLGFLEDGLAELERATT